jgi:hypothetical protein
MEHRPQGKGRLIPAKAFEHERSYLAQLPGHLPAPYQVHQRGTDQYGYAGREGLAEDAGAENLRPTANAWAHTRSMLPFSGLKLALPVILKRDALLYSGHFYGRWQLSLRKGKIFD